MGVSNANIYYLKYYNNVQPLTPNDYTNEFGYRIMNKFIIIVIPTVSGGEPTYFNTQYVSRWYDIKNPFKDIYTILDGILLYSTIININQTKVYINPEQFSSILTENYKLIETTLYQNGWCMA